MSDNKISVSLDEVNSSKVDQELNRQDVASRMAEHQEKIRVNLPHTPQITSQGSFFRKPMVYMVIFGLIASIIGWGLGEGVWRIIENDPLAQALEIVVSISEEMPNASDYQLKRALREKQQRDSKLKSNPYLPDKLIDMNSVARDELISNFRTEQKILGAIYWILLGVCIGIGLSIADSCISKNFKSAIKNGIIAAILGALGGCVLSLFINGLYIFIGGENTVFFKQMLARGVGWGVLGLFIAIAPGIIMKSRKKLGLGIAGGFIGGLIGGLLFDPICVIFGSVVFARFVNVVGMGVGAAAAMVLLENIAKQGWLKVAAGLIAGKQFILYRNPTVIGSSPKSEIYLFKDSQIAATHAAINNRNGDFFITAIDGAQVFVNNVPTPQQRLKTGDQIRIGNTIFIFEAKVLKTQKQG